MINARAFAAPLIAGVGSISRELELLEDEILLSWGVTIEGAFSGDSHTGTTSSSWGGLLGIPELTMLCTRERVRLGSWTSWMSSPEREEGCEFGFVNRGRGGNKGGDRV